MGSLSVSYAWPMAWKVSCARGSSGFLSYHVSVRLSSGSWEKAELGREGAHRVVLHGLLFVGALDLGLGRLDVDLEEVIIGGIGHHFMSAMSNCTVDVLLDRPEGGEDGRCC